jgi:tRNA1(Val) A37 N6-methylase TrmN6
MSLNPDKLKAALLKDLEKQGLGPLTVDDFLGGKVRLIQLKEGYRAGLDAVLLAASIPAAAGDRALDIGAGTGSVAICLAARCAGVLADGLEIQDGLVALAEKNVTLNGLAGRVKIYQGSVVGNPEEIPENFYNHVFANPPYLEGDSAIPPPVESKGIAYVGGEATLEHWVPYQGSKTKAL